MLLEKLDNMYPEGDIIRIICDKHSIHQSKEVCNYLITKLEGRYVFVSFWRNLIKCFFSKMTKQILKGIWVKSKEKQSKRIYHTLMKLMPNLLYFVGHIGFIRGRGEK